MLIYGRVVKRDVFKKKNHALISSTTLFVNNELFSDIYDNLFRHIASKYAEVVISIAQSH